MIKTKIGKKLFKTILENQNNSSAIIELCGCFYYEYNPAGRILFTEGDTKNTNFYFILDGSIGVLVSALSKTPNKKEILELETPRWEPEKLTTKQMCMIDDKFIKAGYPKDYVSVFLPKCKSLF